MGGRFRARFTRSPARRRPRPLGRHRRRPLLRRRRSARRGGRRPPRPLRRRRPRDPDGQGARTAAGRRTAVPVGAGDARARPGRKALDGARVGSIERELLRRSDVASVSGYYNPTQGLRLPRREADLPRGLAEADRQQGGAGNRRPDRRPPLEPARSPRRRLRGGPEAGQQPGGERSADGGDARLPAALPALDALLPQPRRGAAAADDRRPGDRRHLPDPPHRQRIRRDLGLRPQPDHGAGAGAGDRLQPLHRLPLPRGDRQGRPGAGGDAPRARHLGPHSLLLLADRLRGARLAARLPAALPLLDGPRRRPGGAVRGGDLADRAAGCAEPARHPRQRRRAALPPAPRRGRHPARRERVLVPALTLPDAAADPRGDPLGPVPDPPRPALPRDQVQHRRPQRAAEVGELAAGLRNRQPPLPAVPRIADLDRPPGRRPEGRAGGGGRGTADSGDRRSSAGPAPARRSHRDPGDLHRSLQLRSQRGSDEAHPRDPGRRRGRRRWSPAAPPTSSTSRAASPATCRSRWRSWSSPPSSSSS